MFRLTLCVSALKQGGNKVDGTASGQSSRNLRDGDGRKKSVKLKKKNAENAAKQQRLLLQPSQRLRKYLQGLPCECVVAGTSTDLLRRRKLQPATFVAAKQHNSFRKPALQRPLDRRCQNHVTHLQRGLVLFASKIEASPLSAKRTQSGSQRLRSVG